MNCNEIEKVGIDRTEDYLDKTGCKYEFITDVDRQIACGDYDTNHGYLEVKTEENYTGNLFIETWSNKQSGRRGWLFNLLHCDYLFYFFIDQREDFVVLDFQKLRRQFVNGDELDIRAIFASPWHNEAQQGKNSQSNDSWGVVIPITYFLEQKIGRLREMF